MRRRTRVPPELSLGSHFAPLLPPGDLRETWQPYATLRYGVSLYLGALLYGSALPSASPTAISPPPSQLTPNVTTLFPRSISQRPIQKVKQKLLSHLPHRGPHTRRRRPLPHSLTHRRARAGPSRQHHKSDKKQFVVSAPQPQTAAYIPPATRDHSAQTLIGGGLVFTCARELRTPARRQ